MCSVKPLCNYRTCIKTYNCYYAKKKSKNKPGTESMESELYNLESDICCRSPKDLYAFTSATWTQRFGKIRRTPVNPSP